MDQSILLPDPGHPRIVQHPSQLAGIHRRLHPHVNPLSHRAPYQTVEKSQHSFPPLWAETRMLKKVLLHPPTPGAPRRAASRARPQPAPTPQAYPLGYVEDVAKPLRLQDAQKGHSARPQVKQAPEAYPLGYVEDACEPRTKLMAFFSILPG